MRLCLLFAGVLCCAGCCVAARGGQSYVRGPDGQLYPCGPNGCAVAPGQPADPAAAQPALPAPPVPVPTRPLVPVPPKPQPSEPTQPQRIRPEPQIERLEMLNPVQVDPVGPNADSIAKSLQAIAAGVDKALPTWPPGFAGGATANAAANASSASSSAPPAADPPAKPPAQRPQPPPAAQSPVVSEWAWDLLRWSLTGLAGAARVAIPGGAAGVAVWAGWRLVRGAVRRMRSPGPEQASAAASASATATADASTKWYRDQLDALHRQIAALKLQLAEAKQAAGSGDCDDVRQQLAAAQLTIADLQRKLAERPVTYLNPPSDPGLARMRQAMSDVGRTYPSSRTWIQMIEKAYTLLLSGDKTHA